MRHSELIRRQIAFAPGGFVHEVAHAALVLGFDGFKVGAIQRFARHQFKLFQSFSFCCGSFLFPFAGGFHGVALILRLLDIAVAQFVDIAELVEQLRLDRREYLDKFTQR